MTYEIWEPPQVDEVVLRFVTKIHAKGQPITCQAMQIKAEEIVKSLRTDKRFQSNEWLELPITDYTGIRHGPSYRT